MNTILPTLEEAQALYGDVYFIVNGFWPDENITSTWILRVYTEEMLGTLVQEMLVDPNVIIG